MSFEVDTSRHAPSLDIPELKLPNIDDGFFPHSADLQPPFAASAQEVEVDAPNDRLAPPELTVPELASTEAVQVFPEPVQLQKPSRQETAASTETALVFVPGTELGDRHTNLNRKIDEIKAVVAEKRRLNTERKDFNEEWFPQLVKELKRERDYIDNQHKQARETVIGTLTNLESSRTTIEQKLFAAEAAVAEAYRELSVHSDEVESLREFAAMKNADATRYDMELTKCMAEMRRHMENIARYRTGADKFTEADYEEYIGRLLKVEDPTMYLTDWTGPLPSFGDTSDTQNQQAMKIVATDFIYTVLLPGFEGERQRLIGLRREASELASRKESEKQQAETQQRIAGSIYRVAKAERTKISDELSACEQLIDRLLEDAERLGVPDEKTVFEQLAERIAAEREARRQQMLRKGARTVTVNGDLFLGPDGGSFEVMRAPEPAQRRAIESHDTNQTDTSGSHKSFWARLVGRRVVEETAR